MQRGFTLIETLVSVAITSILLLGAITLTASLHPAAAMASAAQFDAVIADSRSLATAGGNGATLVIAPAPSGSGAVMQLYAGRPTQAGSLTASAPVTAINAAVREATLGAPPFTIFFDSTGHASAMHGATNAGSVLPSDPGCPGGAAVLTITLSDARTSVTRTLPCRQNGP